MNRFTEFIPTSKCIKFGQICCDSYCTCYRCDTYGLKKLKKIVKEDKTICKRKTHNRLTCHCYFCIRMNETGKCECVPCRSKQT